MFTGFVCLLKKTQIQGQILGAGQDLETYTFLNQSLSLWSQPTGKLAGTHSWPFSLTPPRDVTVPVAATASHPASHATYQLPPRFSERGSQAHVDYKVVVTVRRRRFSVDST
jgi:hypothetical protein